MAVKDHNPPHVLLIKHRVSRCRTKEKNPRTIGDLDLSIGISERHNEDRHWHLGETFIEFPLGGKKKPSEIPGICFPRLRSFSDERFICARGDNIKTSSGFLFLRRRTLIMSMRDAPEGVNGFCVINVQGWRGSGKLRQPCSQVTFKWTSTGF